MDLVLIMNIPRSALLWLGLFVGGLCIFISCSDPIGNTVSTPAIDPVITVPTREPAIPTREPVPDQDNIARDSKMVTEVVDGLTIKVSDGERSYHINMVGLSLEGVEQDIIDKAKEFLRFLLLGKQIAVEFDPINDRHNIGSSMYVYVDGIMVNKELALKGLARVSSKSGLLHSIALDKAQKSAQQNKLGIWAFESPVSDQKETLPPQVERMGCGTLPCRP